MDAQEQRKTDEPKAGEPKTGEPKVDVTKPKADTTKTGEPQLTYEEARDELIAVVNRLESGGEPLGESMELFKRGEFLADLCENYLTQARATIEAAKQDAPPAA